MTCTITDIRKAFKGELKLVNLEGSAITITDINDRDYVSYEDRFGSGGDFINELLEEFSPSNDGEDKPGKPEKASTAPVKKASADEQSIDLFADVMKKKIAKKSIEGRGGWQKMPIKDLRAQLKEHIEKGDPIDVALYCMMLYIRDELI